MGKRGRGGRHGESGSERVPRRPGQKKLPKPTQAEPGSAEKLAVLAERFRKKQAMWHPDDKNRGE